MKYARSKGYKGYNRSYALAQECIGGWGLVQQGLEFRKASQLARKPTTPNMLEFRVTERIRKVLSRREKL